MELGHVFSPLDMTHEEATHETLLDMREQFADFDQADLETLFARFEEAHDE